MRQEVIIAGFGGQGVMSMGQLLTYAGMQEGKEVSWLPSYGPEQRGGTANVSVVISDTKVGSPVIDSPTSVIVLNKPSFDKFESVVQGGGHLFINADLIDQTSQREDIGVHHIPATTVAEKLGNNRVAGMVMIGAFIEQTGILSKESLLAAFIHVLGENKKHLIPINEDALNAGSDIINGKDLASLNEA
ncbi:2-oxoacid:acceptor oxidoreductase family protein [Bacillus shivajii]|uniref:2-oxoacid:acceptor oxidoreductase family protein n=1 Tax=Bacillus shivajii TaxID=1983719 RepID=UPI001CFA4FE9|nr:2-oxoacid:acceptor oxidoreductase family protein [Bacillus shivajii]UCZ52781.1 2-oxoacid:acceptor oxidoreductase family protein [Bacillus shivajii]